jgi:RNA polymerase sigma-70 factor (ECF subfamily)
MTSIGDGLSGKSSSGGSTTSDRSDRRKLRGRCSGSGPSLPTNDSDTVRKLLKGDEATFGTLVERYNSTMIRLARSHVPSRAVAEEVVQEAWLALLQGLTGFRGKSSLKTWLFGILINRAKTRGKKENRSVAFSSLHSAGSGRRSRQLADWLSTGNNAGLGDPTPWGPAAWSGSPEDRVLNSEVRVCLEKAIARLTSAQRIVLILRDIEGWSSGEVCDLLEITSENQRVRLHRARLRIRSAISSHFARGRE